MIEQHKTFHSTKELKSLVRKMLTSFKRMTMRFDAQWYLKMNPDVAASGIDPFEHYINYGVTEGRKPAPEINEIRSNLIEEYSRHSARFLPLARTRQLATVIREKINRVTTRFDAQWYLRMNLDVSMSGIDPYEHYIKYGKAEGRRPAPDPIYSKITRICRNYHDRHPGFKGLIRLTQISLITLKHGGFKGITNALMHELDIDSKTTLFKIPITLKDASRIEIPDCIDLAVHIHIYYTELAIEIRSYLENIPVHFTLYITTDSTYKAEIIRNSFSSFPKLRSLQIVVVENRGRDILPMIVILGKTLSSHEIVLHIHTKKSPHATIMRGWRRYLLETLLGNPLRVTAILDRFQKDDKLGILFPDPYHPVKEWIVAPSDGNNLGLEKLLLRANAGTKATKNIDRTFFPAGDMFWFRGRAIKPLVDLNLTALDFEEEQGQVDGTLAHAIERSFPFFATKAGMKVESYIAQSFLSPGCSAHKIDLLPQYYHMGLIRTTTLLFDHNMGGGANFYTSEVINNTVNAGGDILRIYYWDTNWFVEWVGHDDGMLFFTSSCADMFNNLTLFHSHNIKVNSFYGCPDIKEITGGIIHLAKISNATVNFVVHDFFALCPSPHLCDPTETYCGVPSDNSECNKCLAHFNKNPEWYPRWYPKHNHPLNIYEWRKPFNELFETLTSITFFDQSSADIFARAFTLDNNKVKVIPHNDNYFTCNQDMDISGPLHIGILGTLTKPKGSHVINALSDYIVNNRLKIPITLLGRALVYTRPSIKWHGTYKANELPQLVSQYGINVIFISSIIPETFSYTISEAIKMRLPIVAFDIGAQGRRVRQYSRGKIVPLDSSSATILSAIKTALTEARKMKSVDEIQSLNRKAS